MNMLAGRSPEQISLPAGLDRRPTPVRHHKTTSDTIGPVLKWAGGKRQLLPTLLHLAPPRFEGYLEPFVGGGAFFFELRRQGRLKAHIHLADTNPRLVTLYQVLRDQPDSLITELERMSGHTVREAYEEARREFNGRPGPSHLRTAALFLYLNRLCFNGLFRVNRHGEFNVPYGRYEDPDVVRAPHLRAGARALEKANLNCEDFATTMGRAQPGDLVYCDPPYLPISETSSFTAYSGRFDLAEHRRLAEACHDLHRRGIRFMLSNSSHPDLLELYDGYEVHFVNARRSINSVVSKRGQIHEIVVRNFDERGRLIGG